MNYHICQDRRCRLFCGSAAPFQENADCYTPLLWISMEAFVSSGEKAPRLCDGICPSAISQVMPLFALSSLPPLFHFVAELIHTLRSYYTLFFSVCQAVFRIILFFLESLYFLIILYNDYIKEKRGTAHEN